jgi:hypothetical protein
MLFVPCGTVIFFLFFTRKCECLFLVVFCVETKIDSLTKPVNAAKNSKKELTQQVLNGQIGSPKSFEFQEFF